MLNTMEMIARERQAKLLSEAAETRMRRLAGGLPRSSVHPVQRLTRLVRGQR